MVIIILPAQHMYLIVSLKNGSTIEKIQNTETTTMDVICKAVLLSFVSTF